MRAGGRQLLLTCPVNARMRSAWRLTLFRRAPDRITQGRITQGRITQGRITQVRTRRPERHSPGGLPAADVDDFAQAIERRFGHQQDPRRAAELAVLLERRLAAAGAPDYAAYRRLLERAGGEEWAALAPLLTVPETYFFRMPEHFEALAAEALPEVIRRNEERRSLRILSAGCATGEEPYSLRILLNERFPQLASWRVSIAGVDLSEAALERARLGEYNTWSLRATSEARRRANFLQVGKLFRLKPEARAGVEFRRENLLDPGAKQELFDVIFCRNVLIYFSEEAIRDAVAVLTRRLVPQGYLFLGPAESLRGVSRHFSLCHRHDTFFYRLKPGTNVTEADVANPEARSRRPQRAVGPAVEASGREQRAGARAVRDESWFETIGSSSARLSALVGARAAGATATRAAATPSAKARQPALPVAPAGPVPSAPRLAAPLQTFAELVAKEHFSQALTLLESCSPADLDSEGVRLLRAIMLTNLGRHAEAEAECRTLLAADDLNAGAHFLLGLCREEAGELAEAAEQMNTATYLDPAFPMAHLHRGLLARRRGDKEAAAEAFGLALHAIEKEDAARLKLFGGGFSREGLRQVCVRELARLQPQALSAQPAGASREPGVPGAGKGAL